MQYRGNRDARVHGLNFICIEKAGGCAIRYALSMKLVSNDAGGAAPVVIARAYGPKNSRPSQYRLHVVQRDISPVRKDSAGALCQ